MCSPCQSFILFPNLMRGFGALNHLPPLSLQPSSAQVVIYGTFVAITQHCGRTQKLTKIQMVYLLNKVILGQTASTSSLQGHVLIRFPCKQIAHEFT